MRKPQFLRSTVGANERPLLEAGATRREAGDADLIAIPCNTGHALVCTELPLLLAQSQAFPVAGMHVVLLDPTDILAQRCVDLVRSEMAAVRDDA